MKHILLSLIFYCLLLTLNAQGYKIGHRQMLWVDSSRNNRQVITELYYPADVNGENVPLAIGTNKFVSVVFGHGYQLTYASYLWLKDSLVPKGFFVAFPRTEEELFPSHTDFAKDLAYIIQKLNYGNSNSGYFFYNRLNNRYAVSGHSMGGGCSLLSVQYSNLITAVAPFAAAETNPSAIAACSSISIPALLFAGKQDCVTPPSSNQLPMYNNLNSICKNYIEINGAKHCHWAVNNFTCTLGEFTCGGFSTDYKQTLRTTTSFLVPWLNATLYYKKSEAVKFNALLRTTSNITFQQNCKVSAGAQASETNQLLSLKVYPTLSKAGAPLFAELPVKLVQNSILIITNQLGIPVATYKIENATNNTISINTSNFQKDFYMITIKKQGEVYKGSFVIQ